MGIANRTEKIGFEMLRRMPRLIRRPIVITANNLRKIKLSSFKTPLNLTLYVTNRCNAQCTHCFYRSELNKPCMELSLEQLKKVAISLKHPLQVLMITGGEPFLRDDLLEVSKLFLDFNRTRRISIDTNGILTDKIIKTVKTILMLKPRTLHIQVSLDGFEQVHDKMRGVEGCYKKAIKTLNELEQLQIRYTSLQLSVMTTICKVNYKDLLSFSKMISKNHPTVLHKFNIVRGARTGTFGLPESITSGLDTEVEQIPLEKLDDFFSEVVMIISSNKDKIWARIQRLKWEYSIKMLKSKKGQVKCLAGYTFGVIYPNGDVAVCEPAKPFANLKDFRYNFCKLWNSDAAIKMKRMTRNCFCIHPCNLLDSMVYDTRALLRLFEIK